MDIEGALGFTFKRRELLTRALTHRSYAPQTRATSNERLEFLGDSVLSAVVAQHLYERHPQEDEGTLSKRKAALVSRAALARWAKDIGVGSELLLGPGEERTGGRTRPSILADAVEALIGAMYLEGGLEPVRRFVEKRLQAHAPAPDETDFKSRLQEILQKKYKVPPLYEVLRSSGPEHDKTFTVTVRIARQVLGDGGGKSKKEAEQAAARDALAKLKERN